MTTTVLVFHVVLGILGGAPRMGSQVHIDTRAGP